MMRHGSCPIGFASERLWYGSATVVEVGADIVSAVLSQRTGKVKFVFRCHNQRSVAIFWLRKSCPVHILDSCRLRHKELITF